MQNDFIPEMSVANLKEQIALKQEQFKELNDQFVQYQEQSDMIINDLQAQIKELKKKNESLSRELNEHREKKKSYTNAIERQMEQAKKEREQFKNKFMDFEQKVIQLENINESLESELRATNAVLSEYQNKTEKYMEQLAVLQIQLEETNETNQEQVARLKTQLKETEEELFAFHHAKHRTSKENIMENEDNRKSDANETSFHSNKSNGNNKMLISKGKRNPMFAETLGEIRSYITLISEKREEIGNKIQEIAFS